MVIYHGSKRIINSPIVKGSNPTNDYGPSFYLTLDLDAAKSWACRNDSVGIVNKYKIANSDYNELKILDLTDKSKYSVLNWLAILMHFRTLDSSFIKINQLALDWLKKYYIDVDLYDVVIGYRADDSYFRFPIKYISNELSLEDLEETFMLGKLGVQLAFMSNTALEKLSYIESIECEESYLGQYYFSVSKATKEFDEILSKPKDPRKTYILDLLRKDYE